MTRITLEEYTPAPVELSALEAAGLRLALPSARVEGPVSPGVYTVTPGAEVGVVRTGDRIVEIQPRLGVERVLFLASYGMDSVRWRDLDVTIDASDTLSEAMAWLFATAAERALRPGVLQGYRVEEEALGVVRGRIRFDDQIRNHYGRTPPIEVRYDEFTEDIELNRVVRAALRQLRKVPLRSERLQARLRYLDHLLEHVTLVEYHPRHLPELTFDRLSDRYRPAVQLAGLILSSTSAEVGAGSVPTTAFTMDMFRVFERFVTVAVREELGLDAREFPQNARQRGLVLDEAAQVRLEPDLSWWVGDRCVFVGDIKYKKVVSSGILHPDLYQLLAYLVATDLPAGLLVYAKGETEPKVHQIRHLGRRIEVMALELGGTPEDLLAETRRVADRIRALRAEAPVLVSAA